MTAEVIVRTLVAALGVAVIFAALSSAIQTLVLPRSASDAFTRIVFTTVRRIFWLRIRQLPDYERRDRLMAFYAPVTLLLLVPSWLALVSIGFAGLFFAAGIESGIEALTISGSSLLTLGFARGDHWIHTLLSFGEATIGLVLVALLIAYLPTMYAAFSRREQAVTRLEVRAGAPPSAVVMMLRYHRLQRMEYLRELWVEWESWFAELEESHTSLAALVFFRSPKADHSWVTAAGAVLDAAALGASTLELERDVQMDLTIRAGYLALRRIAEFFGVPHNPEPSFPEDPISVTREEFEAAYDRMQAAGISLKPDREQAWLDFASWRVSYDAVLIALCSLTMAPVAPWSADRAPTYEVPRFSFRWRP